jgi:ankyrin repeat protein
VNRESIIHSCLSGAAVSITLAGAPCSSLGGVASLSYHGYSAPFVIQQTRAAGGTHRRQGTKKGSASNTHTLKPVEQKRLNDALLAAIAAESTGKLNDLLFRGASPEAADKAGHTALIIALGGVDSPVKKNPADFLQNFHPHADDLAVSLIAFGARVDTRDSRGNTPLLLAVKIGAKRALDRILERKPQINVAGDQGMTPLMYASSNSDLETARELLNRGANVNAMSAQGFTPLGYCILSYSAAGPALFAFSNPSQKEMFNLLASKGADLRVKTKEGTTLLMLAAAVGDMDAMSYLIEKGLDVNAQGKEGITPLMYAALGGKSKALKLLLAKGADPNRAINNGATALIICAERARYAMIEQLLKAGANVNAKTLDGTTALIIAQRNKHTAIVNQLKAAGPGRSEEK